MPGGGWWSGERDHGVSPWGSSGASHASSQQYYMSIIMEIIQRQLYQKQLQRLSCSKTSLYYQFCKDSSLYFLISLVKKELMFTHIVYLSLFTFLKDILDH